MPERRRKIPEAFQRLLDDGDGNGNYESLPPELRPEAVYRLWAKNDPEELYLLQLEDYIQQLFSTVTDDATIDKMLVEVDKLRKRARLLIANGYPVTQLPLYKQVSGMKGRNMQQAYLAYVEQELTLDKQDEEAQRNILFTGQQASGRDSDIAKALSQGTITDKEAEDLRTQRQFQTKENQKLLDPSKMSDQELFKAIKSGAFTEKEVFGSLEQTVDQYGEPVTYRQPGIGGFEERQREQVRQLNAQSQRGGRGNEDLLRVIRDAKAAGIDTSVAERAALGGSLPENTQGLYIKALGDQLGLLRKQKGEEYASYMAKAYPQQYQEYLKTPGLGTAANEGGFLASFSQQPDFENITSQREMKLWDEYGDVMPTYLKQLATKGYRETPPIESWLETDPTGQLFNQKLKEKKAARIESTRRRYAPLVRSF